MTDAPDRPDDAAAAAPLAFDSDALGDMIRAEARAALDRIGKAAGMELGGGLLLLAPHGFRHSFAGTAPAAMSDVLRRAADTIDGAAATRRLQASPDPAGRPGLTEARISAFLRDQLTAILSALIQTTGREWNGTVLVWDGDRTRQVLLGRPDAAAELMCLQADQLREMERPAADPKALN